MIRITTLHTNPTTISPIALYCQFEPSDDNTATFASSCTSRVTHLSDLHTIMSGNLTHPAHLLDLSNELLAQIVDQVLIQAYIDSSKWQMHNVPPFPGGFAFTSGAKETIASLKATNNLLRSHVIERGEAVDADGQPKYRIATFGLTGEQSFVGAINTQHKLLLLVCQMNGDDVSGACGPAA